MVRSRRFARTAGTFGVVLFALVLTACGGAVSQARVDETFDPDLLDPTELPQVETDGYLPDPAPRNADLPDGYVLSFDRDQIRPVYNPTFAAVDEIPWPDSEVVIGVNVNGEQRAYPVGFLSQREIVIDQIDDIPILVSW